ncbi:MAG: carbamoyltransferase family protein [Vicinamibacterales bacterium]
MLILGISCGHDANVCLVDGDAIVMHLEKERFTRRRHDGGDVDALIRIALDAAGATLDDIELVASSIPVWPELGVSGEIVSGAPYTSIFGHSEHVIELLGRRFRAIYVPHHVGHLAYAYYLSGFEAADLIAVDGYGNFTATAFGCGAGHEVRAVDDIPSSVGALWSIVSKALFGSLLDAGKTMGLAAYGQPSYVDDLKRRYYRRVDGLPVIDDAWRDLDRVPVLSELPDATDCMRRECRDMAASIQALTTETMLEYAALARTPEGRGNLCLSGGVALNGIANTAIERSGLYERVFIPPAVNDAGLSIGFATYALHHVLEHPVPPYTEHVSLGRPYAVEDVDRALEPYRGSVDVEALPEDALMETTAQALAAGEIVAWYQGRSESGPRALGHRSLLCHPGLPSMKDTLNRRVKHRQPFRPFGASLLEERTADYFTSAAASPYMLKVADVRSERRLEIAAVVHADGTSRPQTVAPGGSERPYRALLESFAAITGLPLLLNTSFNTRGEPMVESPADAISSFLACGADRLVLMDRVVTRRRS